MKGLDEPKQSEKPVQRSVEAGNSSALFPSDKLNPYDIWMRLKVMSNFLTRSTSHTVSAESSTLNYDNLDMNNSEESGSLI